MLGQHLRERRDGDALAVSVVVPTFNRADSLRRLLDALAEVRPPPGGFEVIVVDDGSQDETEDVVRSTPFTYVRQQNSGAAAARNAGWRVACGEIIAFTDDDAVPSSEWLVELVEPFKTRSTVGVGGTIVPLHRTRASMYVQLERLVDHGLDTDGDLRYLVTANAAFRRSVLAAVGGFDIGFAGAAGEDVDLSVRVAALGGLVRVAGAEVAHDHRLRVRELVRTYRRHGRARAELSRKHPSLALARPAREQLRPSTWRRRFEQYRQESGSTLVATQYLVLRALGVGAFALGLLEGRRLGSPTCDVLIINDIAEIGGGQQVTLDVATALRDVGLTPAIACPPGWLAEQATARAIEHVLLRFRARRMLFTRFNLPVPLAAAMRAYDAVIVRRLMRRTGASWVHSMATVTHVACSLARIGARWRLVWHVNQVHPRFLALLPRPDAVLSPTTASLEPLLWRRSLRERGRVCANAVDFGRFHPPTVADRRSARQMLGVRDDEVVVLAACRLEPAKGLHFLIEAAAGIDGVVLVVAGGDFGAANPDDYAPSLQESAVARGVDLRLLGPRSDVDTLLHAADVAASGSVWEAFGLFLAEAAAAGVPALAFDAGGVPEVVDDGRSGVLVPVGDAEALHDRLRELVDSPDFRTALGSAAAAGALSRFSRRTFTAAVADVYRQQPIVEADLSRRQEALRTTPSGEHTARRTR